MIADVDLWMTFHNARNESSDTYNSEIAAAVLEIAPDFLLACETLVTTLKACND